MRDEGFIRAIQENPKDDTTLLVYADWLDEQGDAVSVKRAEFLRVTVEIAVSKKGRGWKKARRRRLQELAAKLDTDWLALVSRLKVENCRGKHPRLRSLRFDFVCGRRWEEMQPTEDTAVRFCNACEENVHYCDTIHEARQHAETGHCIAVDLGIIRRKGDLEPRRMLLEGMLLGRVNLETLRQDRVWPPPDAVSAERELRKQNKKTEASE
jgi:uncharacterized protein (TIGR02996 family)